MKKIIISILSVIIIISYTEIKGATENIQSGLGYGIDLTNSEDGREVKINGRILNDTFYENMVIDTQLINKIETKTEKSFKYSNMINSYAEDFNLGTSANSSKLALNMTIAANFNKLISRSYGSERSYYHHNINYF